MKLPVFCLFLLLPTVSLAGDGVLEINQTAAIAGGITEGAGCVDGPGFPVTLCRPGSYILTSDLVVPASTSGILLLTDDVSLDLNGFSITGPATCNPSSCPSGSGSGVERGSTTVPILSLKGDRVTVSSGAIRGFRAHCLLLLGHAHIERLLTSDCGFTGINVGGDSVVTHNRVFSVGLEGIVMRGSGSVFAHNTVRDASLGAGQTRVAISGGSATAGNFCDDGRCSARGLRRYYLAPGSIGANAAAACASGFHVASVWELLNPGALDYDTTLGEVLNQGSGPPPSSAGWAYVRDINHCSDWTAPGGSGTHMSLAGLFTTSADIGPWNILTSSCSSSLARVWCIED